jgi:hypothetical protein
MVAAWVVAAPRPSSKAVAGARSRVSSGVFMRSEGVER